VGKGGQEVGVEARRVSRRAHAHMAMPDAWARRIERVRHTNIEAAFAHPTTRVQVKWDCFAKFTLGLAEARPGGSNDAVRAD